MHGKSSTDYVIEDSLYAYFIINSVTTVGLFIDSFYKKRFLIEKQEINQQLHLTKTIFLFNRSP